VAAAAPRYAEGMCLRIAIPVCLVACFALGSPAAAGPIRVGVRPDEPIQGPVLVRVYGHYVSIHNGRSRHWLDAFVPAGERRFIALGPVNPLINVGVSIRIVHPEIVAESAQSHQTPLLLRPVGFDTLEPRSWRRLMAQGATAFGAPAGTPGAHVIYQAAGHLQAFLLEYLPALDESEAPFVGDAVLRAQQALLEEIARYALAAEPAVPRVLATKFGDDRASYQRSLAAQELAQRVQIEEHLHRIRSWLSIDRDQRRRLRRMMEQMRRPQRFAEQLMTAADHARLRDYLNEVTARRAANEPYEVGTSWIDPTSHVAYRLRMLGPSSGGCVRLTVMTDLTRVVDADLEGMTHSVTARFCRGDDGAWSYQRS